MSSSAAAAAIIAVCMQFSPKKCNENGAGASLLNIMRNKIDSEVLLYHTMLVVQGSKQLKYTFNVASKAKLFLYRDPDHHAYMYTLCGDHRISCLKIIAK